MEGEGRRGSRGGGRKGGAERSREEEREEGEGRRNKKKEGRDKKIKRKDKGWTTEDRKPRSVPYCYPPSSSRPRPLQCRSTVKHWRMCEVVEARGFGWEGVGVRAYSNR